MRKFFNLNAFLGYFCAISLSLCALALCAGVLLTSADVHAKNSKSSISGKDYQRRFIMRVASVARHINNDIMKDRRYIMYARRQFKQFGSMPSAIESNILDIAQEYNIENLSFSKDIHFAKLLDRVNIVPASLIVSQAILESNWGRSRFAVEARNFFGQHCYDKGCGVSPKCTPLGKNFEVKKFTSTYESVKSYLKNLNTHAAYNKFRKIRNTSLNTNHLLEGLYSYSEIGGQYLKRIKKIINLYNLDLLD